MTLPLPDRLPTPADIPFPFPFPFPQPPSVSQTVPANYHCDNPQVEQKLADYLTASGQQSSVSREIYRIAEQQGIQVTVLSNEEYDQRYPGSGGVTVGPSDAREVFVPERSIENPSDTSLEHELMHAYVETDSSPGTTLYKTAVDTSLSAEERQAAAAQLFENIGGTREQGEAWLEGLDGIPQQVLDGTGDHMLNSATDRLIYRQKAGQSLDTPETLTIMRNPGKGEAAMYLRGQLNPEEGSPSFWTVLSATSALREMYGSEVPSVPIFDIDGARAQLSAFLDAKIADFDAARNGYATNR